MEQNKKKQNGKDGTKSKFPNMEREERAVLAGGTKIPPRLARNLQFNAINLDERKVGLKKRKMGQRGTRNGELGTRDGKSRKG